MKTSKTKAHKPTSKSKASLLAKKNLKKISFKELGEKLSHSEKPFFILLDNEKFEVSQKEKQQFLQLLLESMGLTSPETRHDDLSTQEVADLLNVSRPFVVKLIDTYKLKSYRVGSHRRVLKQDALEFREKMRNKQDRTLDELAEETQKLNIEFK